MIKADNDTKAIWKSFADGKLLWLWMKHLLFLSKHKQSTSTATRMKFRGTYALNRPEILLNVMRQRKPWLMNSKSDLSTSEIVSRWNITSSIKRFGDSKHSVGE